MQIIKRIVKKYDEESEFLRKDSCEREELFINKLFFDEKCEKISVLSEKNRD